MSLLEAVRELGPRVREAAADGERNRRLDPALAKEFGSIGLWRASVPKSVGGLEIPFAQQLEAFEELARADGAAGWCAMIGGTGSLVYAFLEPDVARALIAADPDGCTGGVFAPQGRAVPKDGGLQVSGRWSFGSGVNHSARMGFGVVVEGEIPDIRGVLLDAADFEIVDTWHVSGLRGTGSHDLEVQRLHVPAERVYRMFGGQPPHEGPLYRFPLFGLLGACVASVCLGIARSAIDELTALAAGKTPAFARRRLADRSHVQMQIALAEAELRSARSLLFEVVADAWQGAEAGDAPTLQQRALLRIASTNAARASASAVDRMYDAGGGTSIYETSRLQRDFRDIHAATQHAVISQPTLEMAGRVLLGVEGDTAML